MLSKLEGQQCFTAHCDQCGKDENTDEEKFDDAADVMRQAGWQERARAGKGRELAHWICQSCKPKPPKTLGRSTPGDGPPSSG